MIARSDHPLFMGPPSARSPQMTGESITTKHVPTDATVAKLPTSTDPAEIHNPRELTEDHLESIAAGLIPPPRIGRNNHPIVW